jgi:AcrR family transcriptional regulator
MEAATRLPRGRHRLSREDVERSQRERMLLAVSDAVSEHGYANTPVAEILRRAGVSRETFYEHFANKEDCFLAAYDAGATIVLEAMGAPFASGHASLDVADLLDRVLERYLAVLASEPALARTFLVEVYAAGPAALARRDAVQQRFVDAVARLVGAHNEEQRFACEALVAAVSALVTQRVCDGRAAEIQELHGPLARLARSTLAGVGLAPSTTPAPPARARAAR